MIADIPLAPGVANNELTIRAEGNKVFASMQLNPFTGNDFGFTASFDGGFTFEPFTVLSDSFFGDVDQGSEFATPHFSVDFENDILHSVLAYNATGQNETYYAGRRYPWFEIQDNGTSAQVAVGGVQTMTGASTFLVGLSSR